jgi:hypothetical protein
MASSVRESIIQNQDSRIGQDRARNRDALALPTRQAEPALAHDRVVSAGQRAHELVGRGNPGGRDDFILASRWAAVGDVGSHGVREQEAVFEDHADIAAERLKAQATNVDTVDRDRPLVRVVEPRNQSSDGRLATPARADERNALPHRNVQGEVVQNGRAAVAEGHAGEDNLASASGQIHGIRRIRDCRRLVEQLEDPLNPDARELSYREDASELAGGRYEERADGQLVIQGEPSAEREDGDLAERGHRLEHRLEARLDAHRTQLRPVQL